MGPISIRTFRPLLRVPAPLLFLVLSIIPNDVPIPEDAQSRRLPRICHTRGQRQGRGADSENFRSTGALDVCLQLTYLLDTTFQDRIKRGEDVGSRGIMKRVKEISEVVEEGLAFGNCRLTIGGCSWVESDKDWRDILKTGIVRLDQDRGSCGCVIVSHIGWCRSRAYGSESGHADRYWK